MPVRAGTQKVKLPGDAREGRATSQSQEPGGRDSTGARAECPTRHSALPVTARLAGGGRADSTRRHGSRQAESAGEGGRTTLTRPTETGSSPPAPQGLFLLTHPTVADPLAAGAGASGLLPLAPAWAEHAQKEQTLQRAHENISLLFLPHHVLMADEKQSLQSAGKQTRRTKQREKHRRSTRKKPTVGNAAISPESSTSTRSLDTTTASESHPESHRQPPPPRKRTLAHAPPSFGHWDTSEHGAHWGPEPHSRLGLPVQPRFLSRGPAGPAHRVARGTQPAAAPNSLPWPAAALSPLPGAGSLALFWLPPLPERGAAAGLTGCWRRGGKPGPFLQAAWQLGAASRPPLDRTRRVFKAPSD